MSDQYGTEGGDGGLYDTGPSSPQPKPAARTVVPAEHPFTTHPTYTGYGCAICGKGADNHRNSAPVEPDPKEALSQAVQVIASPATLLSDVLPPDPSQSKIPQGLAILGCLAVACLWANSMMKEK